MKIGLTDALDPGGSISAVLTAGWDADDDTRCSALSVLAVADDSDDGGRSVASHLRALAGAPQIVVTNTERLFRRAPGGDRPLRRFARAIEAASREDELAGCDIRCRFDVFAYAFLAASRRFQRVMPERREDPANEFRAELESKLDEELAALERFERDGAPAPHVRTDAYLALRDRLEGRDGLDGRRVLAALLVSGPSTPTELTAELGLRAPAVERALFDLDAMGVVLARSRDGAEEIEHLVRYGAIGRVVFTLRETMGLDLLRFVA